MKEKVLNKQSSLLDYPHPGLDPSVWGSDGKFLSNLKEQILNKLTDYLVGEELIPLDWMKKVKIVGSLTSYLYNKDTDLDIHVEVDIDKFMKDRDFVSKEDALEFLDQLRKPLNKDKEMLENTEHPIEFYFEVKYQPSPDLMGIYNVGTDEWEQEPKVVSADFDVEEIEPSIVEIANTVMDEMDIDFGRAKRKVKSIERLQEVIGAWDDEHKQIFEQKLRKKLSTLEDEIRAMMAKMEEIVDQRHKEYEPVSLINLKFKYLQKFGYLFIINQLKELITDDQQLTLDEVPEVKDILSKRDVEGQTYRDDEQPRPSQVGDGQGDMAFDFHDFNSDTSNYPKVPEKYKLRMDQLYTLNLEELKEKLRQQGISETDIKKLMVGRTDYQYTPALPRADQTTFFAYNTIREGRFSYDNTNNVLEGELYWDKGDFADEVPDIYILYILGSWMLEKFYGLRNLCLDDFEEVDREGRKVRYYIEDAFTTPIKVAGSLEKESTDILPILESLYEKGIDKYPFADLKTKVKDFITISNINPKYKEKLLLHITMSPSKQHLKQTLKNLILKYQGLTTTLAFDRNGRFLEPGSKILLAEDLVYPIVKIGKGAVGKVKYLNGDDTATVIFDFNEDGTLIECVPLTSLFNISTGKHIANFFDKRK